MRAYYDWFFVFDLQIELTDLNMEKVICSYRYKYNFIEGNTNSNTSKNICQTE